MELREMLHKLKNPMPGINIYEVVMPDIHTDYLVSLLKLPSNTPVINLSKFSGNIERRLTTTLLSLVSDEVISRTGNLFFGTLKYVLGSMAPDDERVPKRSEYKFPIPPFAASIIMTLFQQDEEYPSNVIIRVPHSDLAFSIYRVLINMVDYYGNNLKPLNVILVFDEKNYILPGDPLYIIDVPTMKFLKYAPLNMYKVSEGRPLLGYIYARARKYPEDMKKLDTPEFHLLLLMSVMFDKEMFQKMMTLVSRELPMHELFELAQFFGILDEHGHSLSYTFTHNMLDNIPSDMLDTFMRYAETLYEEIDENKKGQLLDAIGNVLFFIGDKRYLLYRVLAMRKYKQIGEYALAIHRGILPLVAGKRRHKRIMIELERLVNMQRYVPPEFETWENKVFSVGSPVHMLHSVWIKNAYFEEKDTITTGFRSKWRDILSHMPKTRAIYVLALLLATDVFTGSVGEETVEIARFLEDLLSDVEHVPYVARDLLTYGYLILALYYESEKFREKSMATYQKLVAIASDKSIHVVEGIAYNNIGVLLGAEDLPLRSYERFYRLGITSLIKAGGASGLMSIAMLNYLSIVNAYEAKSIVDNLFDSFRQFIYPKTAERNRNNYYVLKAAYLVKHGYIEEAAQIEREHIKGKTLSENILTSYANLLLDLAYKTEDLSYLDAIPEAYKHHGKDWTENRFVFMAVKAMRGENDFLTLLEKETTFDEIQISILKKLYYKATQQYHLMLAEQKKLITYSVQVGDTLSVAEEELEMGLVHLQLAEIRAAYEHLRRALEIYKQIGSYKMASIVEDAIKKVGEMDTKSFIFDAMVMEMFVHNIVKIATLTAPDRLLSDILNMLISLTPAYQGIVGIYRDGQWQEYAARDITGNIDITPDTFHINWNVVPEHAYISQDHSSITIISDYKDRKIVIHLEDPMYGGEFEEKDKVILEHVVSLMPSLIEDMELKRRSLFDSLTGLYARWYLMRRLEEIVSEASRDEDNVSVLFIDVDNFKKVNDTYGHDMGDVILKEIARKIKETVRNTDIVGRYGGDEIVVVMRHAGAEEAVKVSERIRRGIMTIREKYPEASMISLSIGIASSEIFGYDHEKLLKVADQAMYKAKALGKNRIYIAHT
ncbi:MAG: GGDEF domain-containing protein [Dictyoglomi bacterium]|nr:GGDEF domain-containing protein [Dictyoglomota bacterium]